MQAQTHIHAHMHTHSLTAASAYFLTQLKPVQYRTAPPQPINQACALILQWLAAPPATPQPAHAHGTPAASVPILHHNPAVRQPVLHVHMPESRT
eukprot:CAMPEP_0202910022 /NCGR_PEP_ID=MMETSP1392-20130828/50923_1 /ASSEMBLY_ACC=CAM_ASM_000868 /TAXON_ID=225041 /ORGANISM="Chlamydomonas chlamydogama, Strain SAG 11-48b" /LENGTH=94 /DNA_ID=CAMNT_0049599983 /DNA_START=187 /DNA_END=471 /DNA_ORIENTATION=-